MTYYLFIDDERDPPRDNNKWEIVRTSKEACNIILEKGIPLFISFDHDLGGSDTSMIFIHWLINHCLDHSLSLKEMNFYVHSQNPRGAANIKALIENFQRCV